VCSESHPDAASGGVSLPNFFVSFAFFAVSFQRLLREEERKNLEERTRMRELERLRHSASHVLATAILKIGPEAQFAANDEVT